MEWSPGSFWETSVRTEKPNTASTAKGFQGTEVLSLEVVSDLSPQDAGTHVQERSQGWRENEGKVGLLEGHVR